MAPPKGTVNNPHGRPKGNRALTLTLERAGSKGVAYDGKRIAGKRLLARLLWQGLLTGTIRFLDGKVLQLGPTDWKDMVKFVYQHIDGSPPQAVALTGADGGPIEVSDVRNKLLADLAGDVAADNPDTSPEADQ